MKDKDNIEKFFEERLSSKHFVFRDSDWKKMEQKLEASRLNKKTSSGFFRKGWILTGAAIILAFFLGWYGNKLAENKGQKIKASGSLNAIESLNSYEDNNVSDEELPAKISDQNINKNSEKEIKPSKDLEKQSAKEITSSYADPKNPFVANQVTENISSASAIEIPVNTTPAFVEKINNLTIPEIYPASHKALALVQHLTEDSLIKAERKQHKFSIGLSYAPDLTSAGFFNQQQLAQSFGINLYYKLNKKWIIQTGVSYVKKKYEADPESYMPYENYWKHKTYGYIPDGIYGSCSVIDIPVNITYQWSNSGKLSLLTTAGISNYFLLDQEYYYEFHNYSNTSYGWNTTKNSNFIGGIINASFGISIKVNEKINFQLEPYLKIPLKDIGYGKLKLFSTGSFITVKYNIY